MPDSSITRIEVTDFTTVSYVVSDAEGHAHPGEPHDVVRTLLTITDSDGVCGSALSTPQHLGRHQVDTYVRPILMGADPMRRGALLRRLQHRQRGALSTLPDQTLSVIDQALWDLVGRRLGEPVWKLLGGVRDRVQAYASTMCGDEMEGGLRTPEDYATFAEKLRTQGYAAIKIHTWMPPVSFAPSIAMDIAACEAVREAVGPDYPLMLDSNHWYSRTEALELGRALDRLRFFWYEEPMSEYSIQSYRWLAKRVRTPLIGPESVEGRLQTRAEWISAQACDIVRVGVERSGGIESALHTAILAEAFGMECELHGGGAGTLAVLGAVDNGRWYERGLLHPLVDFEVLPPHLLRRVDVMDTSGYINLPEAPGLGEQFNLDYITATAIERR